MARKPIQHDMSTAYVYAITVDGIVRYIGKGRRYRLREHLRIARRILAERSVGKKIKSNLFYNRLAAAMRMGARLGESIIASGLSDQEAFSREVVEIAKIPSAQLWNSAGGGEGFTRDEAKSKWTPERRARQSEIAKRRWSDPEERRKHSDTIRVQWADPDYRANHVDKQKIRCGTAGLRGRVSEMSKARWADPVFRAAQIAQRRAMWTDPVLRANRSTQNRLSAAKRRAAKAATEDLFGDG